MPEGKHHFGSMLYAAAAALWGAQAVAAVTLTDVSGSVGYTFRSITGSTASDARSNQLRAAINAQGYLWEPWFANISGGLRATQDSTRFTAADTSTRTTILGADLDLSVLAQSRTPFSLSYRLSDTRVDSISLPNPLTALGGYEFQAQRVSLRQSYFTELGDRLQFSFDHGTWESDQREDYKDQLLGVEYNMRRSHHTLSARASYQETGLSSFEDDTEIRLLNLEHFYHPSRALRFDTMASYYDADGRSAEPSANSSVHRDSSMRYLQVSNFAFWRPVDRRLSASAGVRIYDLEAESPSGELDQASISASAGVFYQYTRNLRFDASAEVTDSDATGFNTSSRQRLGALYQSDLREVFSNFSYYWHAEASVQNQDTGSDDLFTGTARIGHDLQRMWLTDGRGTFRLSLSQNVSGVEQSGERDASMQRLDHTGSVSWDLHGESGSTMVHLTLSDSRGLGDQDDSQQFANLQFMRTQNLTLYSLLSGNLTVQMVQRDFNGLRDNDTVTATGQVTYRHMSLFDIAQLRFNSDLRVARAATDEGVDRAEWENRLDYVIGLVDASLSWRYISFAGEQNDEAYNIIYFQVNRRF
ncbi:MAG: hypothetical protein RBT81_04050 [Gammaproteobacteria bacterium]|jgi:hypothetical protein|nr:hypothetical protein [Gammaproteobacteria bacterium]